MMAALHGHTAIVRMILERAPNTAADVVCAYGVTALLLGAQYHHAEIIRLLADHGANLNVRTSDPLLLGSAAVGITALCIAVSPITPDANPRDPNPSGERQLATVRALLRLGAGTLPHATCRNPLFDTTSPEIIHVRLTG